jgi:hypothetical protein
MSCRIASLMSGGRWVVAAAIVLAAGCRHADTVTGRCNVATDCAAGLTCDNSKTCVPTTASSSPCSSTSQCGAGYACDNLGWCVCQNQGMSPDLCGSASLPNYRGVESDGGLPDGSGGSGGSAGVGGKDAGHDMGVDSGFVCHGNQDCLSGKGICADGGVCVGCTADSDCTTATAPICNLTTNTCAACTADAQCVAKFATSGTANPGVCMFQDDGHCATDSETVYVQPTRPAGCLGMVMAGGGTSGMPFCSLVNAIASAGTRSLFVVRGPITDGAAISGSAPISIVGQMSAAITVSAGASGLHVTGTDVYVRSLAIGPATNAAATIGIIADDGAMLRLDGVDVENMPKGGILIDSTASGFNLRNTTANGNGPGQQGATPWGGILILSSLDGGTSSLDLVTVQNNKWTGIVCAGLVTSSGVLATGNMSGDIAPACGITPCTSQGATCGAQ